MNRLKEPEVHGLNNIQKQFDNYQNRAFEKRQSNFFALELCGEAGELANLEKKLWRDPQRNIDMEKLSDEAADVFIALMNYCNARAIHLEAAVQKKLVRIEDMRLEGKLGK